MIKPHYPQTGSPSEAQKNCYVNSWLASPPVNPGENLDLLAVEMVVRRRFNYNSSNSSEKLQSPEECFNSIFGDACYGKAPDILMGDHKSCPRCNPVLSSERELWDVKRTHLLSYCATIDNPKKAFLKTMKVQSHPGRGSRYTIAADSESVLDSWLIGENVITKWTQGSAWDRIIARHHHVIGKGKPNCIYLVGNDPSRAKESLFQKLVAQQVPALPEWEDALWGEFQSAGWVVPLAGSGWQGFKLAVDRDQVLDLLCNLIKRRALPQPNGVPEEIWNIV